MESKGNSDKYKEYSEKNKAKAEGHYKSLCSLLHYFVGVELAVEAKTGRIYEGTLSTADEYMNLTLDDAHIRQNSLPKKQKQEVQPSLLTSVHIRGPTIRYIHFPDDLDLTAVIRAGTDRERAAAQKYSRGKRTIRSSTTGAPSKSNT